MRALPLAVAAASALLLVAGCGGGEPGAAPEGTTVAEAPASTGSPATAETAPETAASETEPADTQPPETTQEPAPQAPAGLPAFTAGYEQWPKLNVELVPARDGDPHLGTKDVFESVEPGAGGVYPDGAVIVKEITRPDAGFVGVVAVMRKVEGSNPDGGDWEFVEYERSGPGEPFTVLAEGQICTSCHMGAADTDYVWVTTLGLDRR
jgi:hypothetical protein